MHPPSGGGAFTTHIKKYGAEKFHPTYEAVAFSRVESPALHNLIKQKKLLTIDNVW